MCAQFRHRGEAGDAAERETPRGRNSRVIGGHDARRAEPLVHEERLGLAVPHDVGDLRRGEVPVDRGVVPARLERGQVDLQRPDAVGQQAGDAVPGLEAQLAQPVGHLVDPVQQLRRGVLGAVRLDHRDPVRILLGAAPETELAHGSPPRKPEVSRPRVGPAAATLRLAELLLHIEGISGALRAAVRYTQRKRK
jgi:hypothetical protein